MYSGENWDGCQNQGKNVVAFLTLGIWQRRGFSSWMLRATFTPSFTPETKFEKLLIIDRRWNLLNLRR